MQIHATRFITPLTGNAPTPRPPHLKADAVIFLGAKLPTETDFWQARNFNEMANHLEAMYSHVLPGVKRAQNLSQLNRALAPLNKINYYFQERTAHITQAYSPRRPGDDIAKYNVSPLPHPDRLIQSGHAGHEIHDPLFYLDSYLRHIHQPGRSLAEYQKRFTETYPSVISVLRAYHEFVTQTPRNQNTVQTLLQNILDGSKWRIVQRQIKLNITGTKHLERLKDTPVNSTYEIYIILRNIMTNALKYTKEHGSIAIDTNVGWGKDSSGQFRRYLRLTLTDNGLGIPYKEAEATLTGKRAQNAQTSSIDGRGQGMQHALQLIQQAGGAVFFESPAKYAYTKRAAGLRVQVMLPLTDSQGSKPLLVTGRNQLTNSTWVSSEPNAKQRVQAFYSNFGIMQILAAWLKQWQNPFSVKSLPLQPA